jgi:hypothetical protein
METNILVFSILRTLEEKYMSFNDICLKLRNNKVEFEQKMLFMLLSKLQLNKFLLPNCIPDQKGFLVKYYFLTRNGQKYIQQNNYSIL